MKGETDTEDRGACHTVTHSLFTQPPPTHMHTQRALGTVQAQCGVNISIHRVRAVGQSMEAGKMALWVKVLATRHGNLYSIPWESEE